MFEMICKIMIERQIDCNFLKTRVLISYKTDLSPTSARKVPDGQGTISPPAQ